MALDPRGLVSESDLSVTKSGAPGRVTTGNELTYTVTFSNVGSTTSTAVTLTDTLPDGVAFVSAPPSQGSCTEASGTVTCNLGSIASGDDATVSINVKVGSAAANALTNTASVAGGQIDLNPSDNTATAQTKFASPTPIPELTLWGLVTLALGLAAVLFAARRRVA